jgi:hypothetical protein
LFLTKKSRYLIQLPNKAEIRALRNLHNLAFLLKQPTPHIYNHNSSTKTLKLLFYHVNHQHGNQKQGFMRLGRGTGSVQQIFAWQISSHWPALALFADSKAL